jgi:hypothetical protein
MPGDILHARRARRLCLGHHTKCRSPGRSGRTIPSRTGSSSTSPPLSRRYGAHDLLA